MSEFANKPGLYGKIPILGDFVTRRLTTCFIDTWDKWLQSALSASKEQLGSDWLEVYLTSPIWHFFLSPGICGPTPWTGILMPSVDKVGRYFPLTLAVPTDPARTPPDIFIGAADWFDQMEKLALSALEDNLDLSEFDRRLEVQALPEPSPYNLAIDGGLDQRRMQGNFTLNISMKEPQHMADAFAQLGFQILSEIHPTYSLWSTTGSESVDSCLRVYENMPPWDAFSELLIGQKEKLVQQTGFSASTSLIEQKNQDEPSVWPTDDAIEEHPEQHVELKVLPSDGPMEKQRILWRSCAGTTVGKHRKINEDAYLECPEIGLWAVADGMGGHSAGDVASRTVIDALATLMATGNLESYAAYTTECLRTVNADLLSMAGELGEGRIIGTTVVVMLAVGKRCAAIWAGDSRLYQYRQGELTQLTSDHSLATELSQQGLLAAEEPEAGKMENIVTRALGAEPDLSFDVVTFDARPDDQFLLCSDGLIKEVQHNEIAQIMKQGQCAASTKQLIELALERGARDNVTVVLARATQTESSEGPLTE